MPITTSSPSPTLLPITSSVASAHTRPRSGNPQGFSRLSPNSPSPQVRPKRQTPTLNQISSSPQHSANLDIPSASSSSPRQSLGTSSPRTLYSDHGTQYTPPDYPPTSTRSSIHPSRQRLTSAPTLSSTTHPAEPAANSSIPTPGLTSGIASKTSAAYAVHPSVAAPATADVSSITQEPPPEPYPRVTPQSSLHQTTTNTSHPTSSQRSYSSLSDASSIAPPSSNVQAPSRARAADDKIFLQADYSMCDSKIIAGLVADMLMELIRYNDEIPLQDGHLTRFHSRAPPSISVHDYLLRLTFHATLSPPILLSMVYLIDQLCLKYPSFTINSLTVHRFLITAATVASKGLSDSFWTNTIYARVGGVNSRELALLELDLLERISWRIVPKPEQLVDYYISLVGRSGAYELESMAEDSSQAIEARLPAPEAVAASPAVDSLQGSPAG